jgi:hypothetical protein
LHTLKANVSVDFHLWMLDGFRAGAGKSGKVSFLPRWWPHWIPKTDSFLWFCKASKMALIDLFIPAEVQWLLVAEQGIVFRGDPARFMRLEMGDAVAAAPLASSSTSSKHYWNDAEFTERRMDRPPHATVLVWINLEKFREQGVGDAFRKIYREISETGSPCHLVDDDVFNQLQLKFQVLTLPENVAWCSGRSRPKLKNGAFAMHICEDDSWEYIGKEYFELRDAAVLGY